MLTEQVTKDAIMTTDWIYSEERLQLRADVLRLLLTTYGGVEIDSAPYSTADIYAAAHDFVSHGNQNPQDVLRYFQTQYL